MTWKTIKFGDLFKQYRIEHIVQDNRDYGQITISKNGYIKFRTTKNGKSIGRKRQFIIDLKKYPNTLLFTRQGVAEGAIAFAPKEVDGCIATENMPMFSLKDGVDRKFVELLLKSEQYKNAVKKLIPTGSAQKSIHERELMQIILTVPSEEEQKKLSYLIDNRLNSIDLLNSEIETQHASLKKLRQLILQEAIEGKLTASWREQNPNVEPASVLLENIKQEKEQLVKDKKIRKQKPLPPINEEEIPFDIPDSWEWCRLGDISIVGTGATPLTSNTEYYTNGTINWITSSATGNDYVYEAEKKITQKAIDETNCNINPIGTLVIAMYGQGKTRGQITELMIEAATNQACATINPYLNDKSLSQFIKKYFKKIYLDIRKLAAGGAQPNLNMSKVKNTILALPPIEEQKEIIKKIESLFNLCDELENQIKSAKINNNIFMQAVLKEAFEG